ncbi:TonB-dependent receptor plug domain-containing protein [Rasiella sp. SM2506]|uniref:TonB-dependent receptor plug domain-containing protein n=1 Tax=Rasiella sp. SM2506 TaxID=3423914 RepID=UPI003D78C30A
MKFSYIRRDLKNIKVEKPSKSLTLEQTLGELSVSGNLQFTQINERYIAIQVKQAVKISVCGILIDSESSFPIANAEIITTNAITTSDSGGNFNIVSVSENEIISILINGFLARSINAQDLALQNRCPFVYVSQDYTYLPEVVLSDFITKGISRNIQGATTISNKNFDILPSLIEPDVLQIAQALPGIDSADETAANLNVRGGTSDEFLILWDDIRMYQTGHFFGLISAFNPNLTKNVTIYKNGTSPRYGEGVSGVIALESNNTIPENFQGGLGINVTSANGYGEIPISEKFLLTISGRTSINTGIGNPVYNEFFSKVFQNTVVTTLQNNTTDGVRSTDEAFNFFDVSVKALWKITPRDEVSYHFLAIDNKLQFTERFIATGNSSVLESELEQQNTTNGFSWQRNWGSKIPLTSKVLLYQSNYNRSEFTNNVDLSLLASNQNKVTEKGLKADVSYKLSEQITITGGYQYTDTEIVDAETDSNTPTIESQENSLFSNAFFAGSTLSFFNGTTNVSSGLRFTHYATISESFVEPRFHIDQKLNANWRATVSGELKHQAVYQTVNRDDNLLGVETRDWLLANANNNKILQSKQLGAGINYSKNNWIVATEFFLKNVEGINTANLGFRNQLQETSFTGEYTIKGAEVSLNKKLKDANIWLSYTYQDNTYTFRQFKPETFRNNLDSNHSLTVAGSYDYKNFSFSLGNTFKSGLPYTAPVAGNPVSTVGGISTINYNAPNNKTLPSYFRSDFSASYAVKLDETFRGKINIAVLNIFNRNNALNRYHILENVEGVPTIRRVDEFSLGLTPNISLQLLF